jgi:ParB family transcriptional regulator, chromosome partitioning protein
MTPQTRRTLRIDDPVVGDVCHMARPGSPESESGRLRDIAQAIHPNPAQPRKYFDDESLAALAESIRERGVLQPIIVQPRSAGGYELIAGERRWRASQVAAMTTIPALVAQPVDGAQSIKLALIENVAREDLGVIEEARTIAALLDELDVTATSLARRLGRSRSDLAHTVRLLDLPDEAIELIDADELSKGHGKVLLTEPDHSRRRVLARRAAEGSWSVRALEGRSHGHRRRVLDLLSRIPIRWRPPPGSTTCSLRPQDARLRPAHIASATKSFLDQSAVDRLTNMLLPPGDEV